MKTIKNKSVAVVLLLLTFLFSCEDLTETNQNPNGVDPTTVHPNLLITTVLSEASKQIVNYGFGDIAGVMQHTQKDAWFSGHNDYDWSDQSWAKFYEILRNNNHMYNRSVELGLEFHQGVAHVMKALMFAHITDIWGDAPYVNALNGDQGGEENLLPAFDSQQAIYNGILEDLETANTLLSKSKSEYDEIFDDADVIYGGDPTKWRKFANSLMLRYYMRISSKDPSTATAGIAKILGNSTQYPIITDVADDANMAYPGTGEADAWPGNTVFDGTSGSNYRRRKMCSTLVDAMQAVNDPRLAVWANRVEVPIVVDAGLPAGTDEVIDGIRNISPDVVGDRLVDTDPDYVGIPPSVSALPSGHNLNPTPGQLSFNPHVSFLNDIYKEASGPLLQARLISAAEVHFILSEAALEGLTGGDAQTHYESAIMASLEAWGVEGEYDTYIAGPAAYNGTQEQILEQKWIASWTNAAESWADFRRTGLPALVAGPAAKRTVLPVRFYYMTKELDINTTNAENAVSLLEETAYSQADGKNSAWSKSWLLQGMNKPW